MVLLPAPAVAEKSKTNQPQEQVSAKPETLHGLLDDTRPELPEAAFRHPRLFAPAAVAADDATRAALIAESKALEAKANWLDETIVEIIISEAQNEVADFKKWDFNIIPHRALMKKGFEAEGGERVDVEAAFKNPKHPFRVAIVCAMWLTGFDVECLSTLYIDKPMKAHTLTQAIARASRDMLASIKARLAELDRFWEKEQTKADIEVFILDKVFASLPSPPFTPEEKKLVAGNIARNLTVPAGKLFAVIEQEHAASLNVPQNGSLGIHK